MKSRILLSVLTGVILSLLLGGSQLIQENHLWFDQIFLFLVPAAAFSLLFWLAFPFVSSKFTRQIPFALLTAILPAAIHVTIMQLAYPFSWQIMVITIVAMLFYGAIIHHGRALIFQSIQKHFLANPLNLLLAGVLTLFPIGALIIALWFPAMFHPSDFLLPTKHFPLIGASIILVIWLASPVFFWLGKIGLYEKLKQAGARDLFDKYLPGLFASLIFFLGYFIIARGFNPPIDVISLNNTFFAADSFFWQIRLGTPHAYGIGRAVHPLALLVLRIPTWILAFLHNGNWQLAALLLVTLTGAGCVFLIWRFVFHATGNTTYALAFASLLGISTAHLIFSTITETYIFSAFGLLWLFTLLQPREGPVSRMIPAGLLTLGITVSNFAQSLIVFFIIRRNRRDWLTFTSITLAAGVALTLFTNQIYPRWNTFFFSPTDLLFETKHTGQVQLFNTRKRTILLAKNLFLYNIAAPIPMHKDMEKEGRKPYPQINFFYMHPTLVEYRQHQYSPPAIFLWSVLLLSAFLSFFIQNRKTPHLRFQLATLALLAFNFLLHFDYGFELFLYTANWTYLVIIFVALSLAGLANRNIMHLGLIACLLALTVNNVVFLRILAGVIQPYLL